MLGDDNFIVMVRKGVEAGSFVYSSSGLILAQGIPTAEIIIDQQSIVYTSQFAKDNGIWPLPPQPEPVGPEDIGETGPSDEPQDGETETEPEGKATLTAEGPFREAMTELLEDANKLGVKSLAALSIRVHDSTDGFRLVSAVNGISGPSKRLTITAAYETTDGSSVETEFDGQLADAQPLKDFLDPQFRAASETQFKASFTLVYDPGLPTSGDEAEKLKERLARFVTSSVVITAEAGAEN